LARVALLAALALAALAAAQPSALTWISCAGAKSYFVWLFRNAYPVFGLGDLACSSSGSRTASLPGVQASYTLYQDFSVDIDGYYALFGTPAKPEMDGSFATGSAASVTSWGTSCGSSSSLPEPRGFGLSVSLSGQFWYNRIPPRPVTYGTAPPPPYNVPGSLWYIVWNGGKDSSLPYAGEASAPATDARSVNRAEAPAPQLTFFSASATVYGGLVPVSGTVTVKTSASLGGKLGPACPAPPPPPPPPPQGPEQATLIVQARAADGGTLTVNVSYSLSGQFASDAGAPSGSQATPFALSRRGGFTVTLSAPTEIALGSSRYRFAKWVTQTGMEWGDPTVTVTAPAGLTTYVTAVYQRVSEPQPLPQQQVKLTVQVYRVDAGGSVLGAANGTRVKVGDTVYTADGSGRVSVTVSAGSTVSVQVLDTYYGQKLSVYWRRYAFWRWSDGSTSNPRSFTVSSSTTVTAYVYDERLLLVLYDPRYGSDPWGVKALQLPDRYASYVNQKLPWNASFWLRPGESFTLQAVEGGAARFLRWDIATECYPRNPYSVDPIISLTIGSYGVAVRAVFRLGPSNQTMYLPGEGIPNPVFWSIYEQYAMGGCDGRKGTWLLNVSAVHAAAQTAFASDNRTWIYALLVNSSNILQSAWVPVNGSWTLYMDRDWDALAHKLDDCSLDNPYADACRYVAYDANSVSDFPQVVAGAPSKYRGWRLIGLAAWKPLLPGESYSGSAISAVWSGSATYALYNVTFKHVDSGWVYWQPVAVSALKIESAVARYKLSGYDGQLRRSPIFMWIEAVVDWAFVPPNSTLPSLPPNVTLWMAGFKPSRVWNVGVALENGAGVVVWAPRGSAYGATGRLYTLAIGDTELFYREPRGLNFGARGFRLVARFVARAAQPGVRVDDGVPVKAELGFTLAPANAIIADWRNNDPSQLVIDWDCFRSGSIGFGEARMGVNYMADLYYEWGPVDPYNGTLPPLGRKLLNSVYPTVLVSDVDPDYWVAFYPIPAGNQYPVAPNSVVPVPLVTKFPPRARG